MTDDDVITAWARRWNIPPDALTDLQLRYATADNPPAPPEHQSEAAIQALVRLEASRRGARLWRNNVGAGTVQESGSFLRWGLANDSASVNAVLKSGDLIGLRPVRITPVHVGLVIGQFVSREIKAAGWKYRNTERERAQLAWITLINAMGGSAAFASGTGTL